MTPNEKKRAERLDFLTQYITSFREDQLPGLVDKYLTNQESLSFALSESAPQDVAFRYWRMKDKLIQPMIKSDDGEEKLVDLYKILSCTEYAIMITKPIVLLKEGKEISYRKSDPEYQFALVEKENLANAHLAFKATYELLSSWEGDYKRIFQKDEVWDFLNSTEEIEVRKNSMTYLEEHISLLAYSVNSSSIPVFTNSTWWRMLCVFVYNSFKE